MDLVETCHVWWIPSFKGVQRVSGAMHFLTLSRAHCPNGDWPHTAPMATGCTDSISMRLAFVCLKPHAAATHHLPPVSALIMHVAMLTCS